LAGAGTDGFPKRIFAQCSLLIQGTGTEFQQYPRINLAQKITIFSSWYLGWSNAIECKKRGKRGRNASAKKAKGRRGLPPPALGKDDYFLFEVSEELGLDFISFWSQPWA
jgi:hypothetical protein